MKALTSLVPSAARLLLGLIFFVFGLNGFLNFLPVPQPQGDAAQFMGGLAASGYFFPLLKITEIAVGAALLANRFVPLALVVLAPITVNILGYHGALDPAGMALPLVILVAQLVVAWHFRASFRGLLAARSSVAPVDAAPRHGRHAAIS